MSLNFYDIPWQLDEAACPCDVHFNEYLSEHVIRGKTIFHFGTGAHHIVGLTNANRGNPNLILGITASKGEYATYMDLVSSNAQLAKSYKAIYADIYSLNECFLPKFDIVTLFHWGEYWVGSGQGMHGEPALETPLSDEALLHLFLGKVKNEGMLALYSNSAGWSRISPIVSRALQRSDMARLFEFKSLQFFAPKRSAVRRVFSFIRD